MKKAVTTALVALCFSPVLSGTPGMAPASFSTTPDPTAPPPPLVVVAKFLGLSEPQQAQFRELLAGLQGTASELEQQIGAKQAQLEQLVLSCIE